MYSLALALWLQTATELPMVLKSTTRTAVKLETVLALKKEQKLVVAAYNSDYDLVVRLIEEGADCNRPGGINRKVFVNNRGGFPAAASSWTALHAVSNGVGGDECLRVAKKLIEGGTEVDARTMFGETPLMLAIRSKYSQLAVLLIEAGADINAATTGALDGPTRVTALHLAVAHADEVVVDKLISRKVMVAKDSNGDSAVDWILPMSTPKSLAKKVAVLVGEK